MRFADWLIAKITYIPNHGPCQLTHTHLVLFEDSVNSEHMIQHFIKEHQWHIQLLIIEDLKPGTA